MGIHRSTSVDTGCPTRMEELAEGERLLVWSYRRWIVGMRTHEETHWAIVSRELGCVLGPDGARGFLGSLNRIIRDLAFHARRPVRLHPPCCCMVCADEMSLVALAAACQRRDHHCARSIAERLVRLDGVGDAIEAARILADGLAEKHLWLPDRLTGNGSSATRLQKSHGKEDDPASFPTEPAEFAPRVKRRF